MNHDLKVNEEKNEWRHFKTPLAAGKLKPKDYAELAIQAEINNTYKEAGKIFCDLVFSMMLMKKPENEINQKTILRTLKGIEKKIKEKRIAKGGQET
jgi:hypothetical protein